MEIDYGFEAIFGIKLERVNVYYMVVYISILKEVQCKGVIRELYLSQIKTSTENKKLLPKNPKSASRNHLPTNSNPTLIQHQHHIQT